VFSYDSLRQFLEVIAMLRHSRMTSKARTRVSEMGIMVASSTLLVFSGFYRRDEVDLANMMIFVRLFNIIR